MKRVERERERQATAAAGKGGRARAWKAARDSLNLVGMSARKMPDSRASTLPARVGERGGWGGVGGGAGLSGAPLSSPQLGVVFSPLP